MIGEKKMISDCHDLHSQVVAMTIHFALSLRDLRMQVVAIHKN